MLPFFALLLVSLELSFSCSLYSTALPCNFVPFLGKYVHVSFLYIAGCVFRSSHAFSTAALHLAACTARPESLYRFFAASDFALSTTRPSALRLRFFFSSPDAVLAAFPSNTCLFWEACRLAGATAFMGGDFFVFVFGDPPAICQKRVGAFFWSERCSAFFAFVLAQTFFLLMLLASATLSPHQKKKAWTTGLLTFMLFFPFLAALSATRTFHDAHIHRRTAMLRRFYVARLSSYACAASLTAAASYSPAVEDAFLIFCI